MPTSDKSQFGNRPQQYNFILNPYPDHRISRCPLCDSKTGQRKLPLLIHIDPHHLLALNYTCRYCQPCDLLIGHKHEIEHLLFEMFRRANPAIVGNDYLIVGTLEKKVWREGLTQPKGLTEMMDHISDFKTYYTELSLTQSGWYGPNQKPSIMEPPVSPEWVKNKRGSGRK